LAEVLPLLRAEARRGGGEGGGRARGRQSQTTDAPFAMKQGVHYGSVGTHWKRGRSGVGEEKKPVWCEDGQAGRFKTEVGKTGWARNK